MSTMNKHIYDQKNGLTYTLCGDCYLPDINLSDADNNPLFIQHSIQAVYIRRQCFAIIVMIEGADDVIRLHALIHIVVGAVFQEGKPEGAGNGKGSAPRGDHGPYRAAATAGDTAHQLHAAFRFKAQGTRLPQEKEMGEVRQYRFNPRPAKVSCSLKARSRFTSAR